MERVLYAAKKTRQMKTAKRIGMCFFRIKKRGEITFLYYTLLALTCTKGVENDRYINSFLNDSTDNGRNKSE